MTTACTFTEVLFLDLAQQLPAAPRLLAELGRLVRAPQTDAADVVALLRRDPALVSRVLRMANSAAYARAVPIGAIEDAVVAVGFGEVHRLVGALAAVELSDQPLAIHGISGVAYRSNALFVATLMEELGARAQLDGHACYTVGLLRSIGKVVLDRAAQREEAHIPPFSSAGENDVGAWERRHWGVDGWQVTAGVLRHWQFPEDVVAAIEFHANPIGRGEPIVHLLQLAAATAARDGYGLPGEHPRCDESTLAAAGISETQFAHASERAEETFKRLRASIV
jgi:HD-like signal output (HDOD) protein